MVIFELLVCPKDVIVLACFTVIQISQLWNIFDFFVRLLQAMNKKWPHRLLPQNTGHPPHVSLHLLYSQKNWCRMHVSQFDNFDTYSLHSPFRSGSEQPSLNCHSIKNQSKQTKLHLYERKNEKFSALVFPTTHHLHPRSERSLQICRTPSQLFSNQIWPSCVEYYFQHSTFLFELTVDYHLLKYLILEVCNFTMSANFQPEQELIQLVDCEQQAQKLKFRMIQSALFLDFPIRLQLLQAIFLNQTLCQHQNNQPASCQCLNKQCQLIEQDWYIIDLRIQFL